jgi:Alkylmercury lyase
MQSKTSKAQAKPTLDSDLRLYIYRHFIRHRRVPLVAEMAAGLPHTLKQVKAALTRLSATHAFVLQENGELWRAAPFSAVPTAFPVKISRHSWYGNCIWDALGIAAMLHRDASINTFCACCNYEMVLKVKNDRLLRDDGVAHFAVPARDWYKDIAFT